LVEIDKEILIEELVQAYPKAVGFLMRKGIVCIQCGEPVWGTLEEAAVRKGVNNVDELVADLKNFLKQ
jgi:hybrid cluster-associated redox disulfide protein